MIKEFKNPTIIITKEAWKVLTIKNRIKAHCSQMTDEQLESRWFRMRYRNGGASDKIHPINSNEVRISKDSFNFTLDQIKEILKEYTFTYREDGFIEEGCYM